MSSREEWLNGKASASKAVVYGEHRSESSTLSSSSTSQEVALIRRPGKLMLTMAIERLIMSDNCPNGEGAIDGPCGPHLSCEECWTSFLKWERILSDG